MYVCYDIYVGMYVSNSMSMCVACSAVGSIVYVVSSNTPRAVCMYVCCSAMCISNKQHDGKQLCVVVCCVVGYVLCALSTDGMCSSML